MKSVVQQQRVAAELFDRVPAAFHTVLVDQHNHILEVRGQHVGFVAGGFGIQQQRFAVGNNARRRAVLTEKQFVDQAFRQRGRFRTVTTRQNGHGAALVPQFARELLHDRRLAGAADREISDGDDLDAQGGIAEDADVVKEAARLDGDLKNFGQCEQGGPMAAAVFKDDFEDEGFNRFGPGTESLAHVRAVCQ